MTSNSENRPLSPHLSAYRWELTMTLSILHRATGIANAGGLLLAVAWLVCLATGPDAFDPLQNFLASPFGQFLLIGWSLSVYWHLCSGLRHLAYDAGWLFPLKHARAAGVVVVVSALALTAATWGCIYLYGGQ
jgi:succinate dehydrogenase / fumarate reductase cytochrome b subunit